MESGGRQAAEASDQAASGPPAAQGGSGGSPRAQSAPASRWLEEEPLEDGKVRYAAFGITRVTSRSPRWGETCCAASTSRVYDLKLNAKMYREYMVHITASGLGGSCLPKPVKERRVLCSSEV